jgi:outer membrane lipoprotein-sorting protein
MKLLPAVLSLLAVAGRSGQEPPSAEELLKGFQDKVRTAKTLHVEYQVIVRQGGAEQGTIHSIVLLRGKDQWKTEIEVKGTRNSDQDMSLSLLSNGRKVMAAKPGPKSGLELLPPEVSGAALREAFESTLFPFFFMVMESPRGMKPGACELSEIKDGGKEKVGDLEGRVVLYTIKFKGGFFGENGMPTRLTLDPKGMRMLRRETTIMGATWVEEYKTFSIDENLPDSEFVYQSLRRLAVARAEQLARSVELYQRFTGRPPRSLGDLVHRPPDLEKETFYPEGGFLLARDVPRDPWGRPYELAEERGRRMVVCRGADGKPGGEGDDADAIIDIKAVPGRQAVGAPTERLRQYYTARVQIHLLAATVRAFQASYGEYPGKKASFWDKQDWMTVWPEGGWLPAGRMPTDPWGEPYRMISDDDHVRVQTQDPKARALSPKTIEAAERAALETAARPRLTDDEKMVVDRCLEDLSNDDLDRRERAEGDLKALGLAIVPVIDDRLKVEQNPEALGRLNGIRKSIRVPKPAWSEELAILSVTVRPSAPGSKAQMASNERNASASLKTLATAEADFRANDRDNNHVNDFWTGDVAGLYTIVPAGGKDPIKLIELSVAAADGAPLEDGAAITKFAPRAPKAGYYFRVMTSDKSSGTSEPYQTDTGGTPNRGKLFHTSAFGFCAYPAEYSEGGLRTFIINEGNTVFWKDTEGEPLLEWPSDKELADEWHKLG